MTIPLMHNVVYNASAKFVKRFFIISEVKVCLKIKIPAFFKDFSKEKTLLMQQQPYRNPACSSRSKISDIEQRISLIVFPYNL